MIICTQKLYQTQHSWQFGRSLVKLLPPIAQNPTSLLCSFILVAENPMISCCLQSPMSATCKHKEAAASSKDPFGSSDEDSWQQAEWRMCCLKALFPAALFFCFCRTFVSCSTYRSSARCDIWWQCFLEKARTFQSLMFLGRGLAQTYILKLYIRNWSELCVWFWAEVDNVHEYRMRTAWKLLPCAGLIAFTCRLEVFCSHLRSRKTRDVALGRTRRTGPSRHSKRE